MITPGQISDVPLGLLELELQLDRAIVNAEAATSNGWPATLTAHHEHRDSLAVLASRYSGKGWRVSYWHERDRVHIEVRKP